MKFFISVSMFLVVLTVQTSCSGDAAVVEVNQNIAVQSTPAAEINTAAGALAEGNRLFDDGDTEKAIGVLNQAIKLDPDLAEAHFKLGIAYSLMEAQDNSAVEQTETPTPTPKGKKPAEQKTNSERSFESAVAAYKKLLAVNDEDDLAHFNLGLAYNKLNEDEDAAKSLEEAVKLKPEDTHYQTEFGAVLIKLAKYHEAVAALKKAFELDPTNTKAEDLLEKAQAGRKRIDFVSLPKDDKKSSKSEANTNTSNKVPGLNEKPETPDPRNPKSGEPKKTPGLK